MITLALFLFLSCTIFLSAYLPGRILISKLNLSPLERVACSFAITLLLLYFLGFGSYVFFLSPLIPLVILFSISLIIFLVFLKNRRIPKEEFLNLSLFFIIFLILVSIQGLLPYYTGGIWYFDWFEHYDRALFFLNHFPLTHQFGPYLLTARPPLFNVVSAVFMHIFGSGFSIYQITSTLLNSLIYLPALLIFQYFLPHRMFRRVAIPSLFLAALFLLNPAIIIQATFTWTKSLSAFYVLMGFYFYLTSRNPIRWARLILSSVLFALSYLTHYSAGSYAVIIGIDLFFLLLFFRKSVLRLFLFSAFFLAVVSPWFFWAVKTYGGYQTFLGNTTFEWQKSMTITDQINKTVSNMKYNLLPLIPDKFINYISYQTHPIVKFYDVTLDLYAATVPGNLTLTLSLILLLSCFLWIIQVVRKLPKLSFSLYTDSRFFTMLFLFIGTAISIIVLPVDGGLAHITLFPSALLLWVLAAVFFSQIRNRFLIRLCLLLIIIEGVLGIGIRIYSVAYPLNPDREPSISYIGSPQVLQVHMDNYLLKKNNSLVFLYDRFSSLQPLFAILIVSGYIACVAILWKILLQPQIYGKNQ